MKKNIMYKSENNKMGRLENIAPHFRYSTGLKGI